MYFDPNLEFWTFVGQLGGIKTILEASAFLHSVQPAFCLADQKWFSAMINIVTLLVT